MQYLNRVGFQFECASRPLLTSKSWSKKIWQVGYRNSVSPEQLAFEKRMEEHVKQFWDKVEKTK